jgi:N-acetylglutamate synthase-like GNAT family acetyltransferase
MSGLDEIASHEVLPEVSISRAESSHRRQLRSLLIGAHIGNSGTVRINEMLVATSRGKILGCAGLEMVDCSAIVHSVSVRKEWRRRGVGLRLIRECMSAAGKQGAIVAALTTMFWNVGFFRKCGFETVSRKVLPSALQVHKAFCAATYRYTTPMIATLRASQETSSLHD